MRLKSSGPVLAICAFACCSPAALAQDKGTTDPKPLPPLANPADPRLPAKEVFGRALTPAEAQARSIGYYWRGCLAGAKALPVDGESWQVVRLSRNRMWGNPAMIAFLERFSRKAKAEGVWNGILVGDISQPRGGPMLTGHASHQVGLDADVWLTPMPDRTLSLEERENMSAVDMVAEDGLSVDRAHWTPGQAAIIKAAAEEPEVDRTLFIHGWPLAVSHRAFLIAALTKMRSTSGSSAAARMIAACLGVQCVLSTESPSSVTMSTADMVSRSSFESVWSGIGVSQTSASRPT